MLYFNPKNKYEILLTNSFLIPKVEDYITDKTTLLTKIIRL